MIGLNKVNFTVISRAVLGREGWSSVWSKIIHIIVDKELKEFMFNRRGVDIVGWGIEVSKYNRKQVKSASIL